MTERTQAAVSALFAWPAQTAVGRPVPKTKVYAHARPGSRLRDLFVAQVEQILWAHKLAPETVNLAGSLAAPEIQVFRISLKTPVLDDVVLAAIDRAIPFPILFELQHAGRVQAAAAYKRPSAARDQKWVATDHFRTAWQDQEAPRTAMPIALDLESLYQQIVRAHLSLPARPGESLPEQIERMALVRRTEVAERKLAADLAREAQFNRKVDINAELRTIRARLSNLTR